MDWLAAAALATYPAFDSCSLHLESAQGPGLRLRAAAAEHRLGLAFGSAEFAAEIAEFAEFAEFAAAVALAGEQNTEGLACTD